MSTSRACRGGGAPRWRPCGREIDEGVGGRSLAHAAILRAALAPHRAAGGGSRAARGASRAGARRIASAAEGDRSPQLERERGGAGEGDRLHRPEGDVGAPRVAAADEGEREAEGGPAAPAVEEEEVETAIRPAPAGDEPVPAGVGAQVADRDAGGAPRHPVGLEGELREGVARPDPQPGGDHRETPPPALGPRRDRRERPGVEPAAHLHEEGSVAGETDVDCTGRCGRSLRRRRRRAGSASATGTTGSSRRQHAGRALASTRRPASGRPPREDEEASRCLRRRPHGRARSPLPARSWPGGRA